MGVKPSSFKFDEETKRKLSEISKRYDRDMTWVLRRLVERQHEIEFVLAKPETQSYDLNDQGSRA